MLSWQPVVLRYYENSRPYGVCRYNCGSWVEFVHIGSHFRMNFVKLDRMCQPLLKACMHCVDRSGIDSS